MQISLNIIDVSCLHIFFWIRSNSRITFIVLIYALSIVVCIPSTLEYRRDLLKRQITLCNSSNILKQKLHHFGNRSSPDDGPKSGRKY